MKGTPECPIKNCTAPVDLILESNSGDKFGAHKHNLQAFCNGFPLSDSDITNCIPALAESTDVLRLMLCFMHHVPQPSLQMLPFETVAALADAAEKYVIFSARDVCRLYMASKVEEHPVAVLGYACRYNYNDIASKAAPLTLNADAQTVSKFLGPEHMVRWFKYREIHLEKFRLICVRARLHGAASWRARGQRAHGLR